MKQDKTNTYYLKLYLSCNNTMDINIQNGPDNEVNKTIDAVSL